MSSLAKISVCALLLAVAGCATHLPRYRMEALTKVYGVKMQGSESKFPAELESIQAALDEGDRLLQQSDAGQAEQYYLIALRKAEIVQQEMEHEAALREEERIRAEELKKEEERQRALEDLKRKFAEEREREERETRKRAERVSPPREREREVRPLPQYHTVKRGETLPQIAAQVEVYNDASLWPLLYRANRDQIRDPRRIWPGQVLRIPRNVSREDIAEARRYAQERQLP